MISRNTSSINLSGRKGRHHNLSNHQPWQIRQEANEALPRPPESKQLDPIGPKFFPSAQTYISSRLFYAGKEIHHARNSDIQEYDF